MKRWATIPLLATICFLLVSCTPTSTNQSADVVLKNGKVFTADDNNPWAEAVAIKGDKIIFVGDDAGVEKYITEETSLSNLERRLLIPGMIDSHTHPGYIDVEKYDAVLPQTSHDEVMATIQKYLDDNPGDDWVRLCCWPVDLYVRDGKGPDRRTLDEIAPDRPVWITSSLWHSYWLNSKALEVLGVDALTADPAPGVAYYVRDENGDPTGWVKEGAGWAHFANQFPADPVVHEAGIRAFLQTLNENGVTTVYDAGNLGYDDVVHSFLARLEKAGELPLRYEGTYQIFDHARKNIAIAEMKRNRRLYGGKRLQFNTIKLFMDGINENRSGAMIDAYDDNPESVGITMMTVEDLRNFLLELNVEKFDLHVHTIGDLAVKRVLDAVELAQSAVNGEFYPRVTLSHLEIIDPPDLERFAELGVIANFTPWWHGVNHKDPTLRALGQERYDRTYVAKPLFDSGAIVTFSSDDWHLEFISPFLGMQVAHTRQYPKEWNEEYSKDKDKFRKPESERLDIESILRAYTSNGAYQFRMEDQIGSLEAGKLADLVILDDDLFEMNRYDIAKIKPSAVIKIKPSAVMMEGKLIHGELP